MDDAPGVLTPGLSCESCGTALATTAKFCSECGAPRTDGARSAEYKQVTVLFADVVRSMDIAAQVGAKRLREIMTDLVELSTAVVRRYGGIADKFTGDGIMAIFGAPAALEDLAIRACLAALGIQEATAKLAKEVQARDAVASLSQTVHGVVLACRDGADRAAGIELLVQAREHALDRRFTLVIPPIANSYIARGQARRGEDLDGAIELARTAVADSATSERCVWLVVATAALVEALLARGTNKDLDEANVAIDALAAAPTDPGYVVNDIAVLRLRALLAQARGNADLYRGFRDRDQAMATSLGFKGHIAMAEAIA